MNDKIAMSPSELVDNLKKCSKMLESIKRAIGLQDTETSDSVDDAVDLSDLRKSLENDKINAEMKHLKDKDNMKTALFVTDADFMRISDALQTAKSVDEWMESIKSITGEDYIGGYMYIAKCLITSFTIEELFELSKKSNQTAA